jgi:hypothetical protein
VNLRLRRRSSGALDHCTTCPGACDCACRARALHDRAVGQALLAAPAHY